MKYPFLFSKKAFYGSGTPSPTRIVAINVFLVSFLLFMYGIWADFIPSKNWQFTAIALAASLSAAVLIFLFYVTYIRKSPDLPERDLSQETINFIVAPFASFLVFWAGLSHGLPALVTRISGSDHSEIAVLKYEHKYSRRSCRDRLTGPSLDRAFPNWLCAPPSLRLDQPQHIKLSGKSTSMGFYVIYFQSNR